METKAQQWQVTCLSISARKGQADCRSCTHLSLPLALSLHVMLSSSIIPSALFSLCLPPFFPPQVPPPSLQLLPFVLDPASSCEFSRLFQPLSLGSLPHPLLPGCSLQVAGLSIQHERWACQWQGLPTPANTQTHSHPPIRASAEPQPECW